jgi:hypothetical protein
VQQACRGLVRGPEGAASEGWGCTRLVPLQVAGDTVAAPSSSLRVQAQHGGAGGDPASGDAGWEHVSRAGLLLSFLRAQSAAVRLYMLCSCTSCTAVHPVHLYCCTCRAAVLG